jgi:plastocyanin
MRGRRLGSVAAAGGGTCLLALLPLTISPGPRSATADVPPPGARVSIEEAPPECARAGFCYAPAAVRVGIDSTVTWFNNTDGPHTVTRCTRAACAGEGPGTGPDGLDDSGQLANGGSWFFTFRSPGTYLYYCTVDGYRVMHGSVTVADTGPRATPTPAQPLGVPLPALPPLPRVPGHGQGSAPGHGRRQDRATSDRDASVSPRTGPRRDRGSGR